ncbi:hypothetical protein CC85DRAFT_325605 [Cutaneotrichosporon oleaginosum]|uniref:Uncharacterized protein n=1 Tax=Cutaneotrichosporon oleaginosum TaxID=879819 RepID=A0A0J0XWQ8_9TREE|nr:uncharacterized protein CC85DRAFT_325605 [Cutaneotrichosporon oleaginosum]KLT45478.1 hypothetical protein CC85DRAFT_325605 [Cutaneotrichosporon oleaginosum]TXT14566.1 hypothetical protein COLE_00759 [Cutaneotrichosporon oleaginosum]
MLLGSESPTPVTGPTHCLLDSPPGRLRSGLSRSPSRPTWLHAADIGHPLVRCIPKRPVRRNTLNLPPSSPIPNLLPRSSPWLTSSYADAHEDVEMPLNDIPRPMSRMRPPTPHPRSSSTVHPRPALDAFDDDTLPDDEIEVARSGSSPKWSPGACVVPPPLAFQGLLMNGLESRESGSSQPPSPSHCSPPPPILFPDNISEGSPELATWDLARDQVLHQNGESLYDRWGFAMIRGMTSGYEPYHYSSNPSSESVRLQRRRLQHASPIEWSPTPSPRPSASSKASPFSGHSDSKSDTPQPSLPKRNAWRGGELYKAWIGAERRWPAPRLLDDDDSDIDETHEETRRKAKRKRKRTKGSPAGESRELSPDSLQQRQARIRRFEDIDNNYQLHVEHVLG